MKKIGTTFKGFSLIETSLVLLIFGIIVAAISSILPTIQQRDNALAMNRKLDEIQKAIDTFYSQNGYLPCPARLNAAPNTANFGMSTDCNIPAASIIPSGSVVDVNGVTANEHLRTGVVPTRTLNLPDDDMYDIWNNRISYTVVRNMAISNALFAPYVSNQSDVIRIQDAGANRIPQPNSSTYPNVVAYTLVSFGPNSKGATNYLGTAIAYVACTGGLDAENCNNNATFTESGYNTDPASFYDDYIRWKTKQQIMREVTYSAGGGGGGGPVTPATANFDKYALFVEQYADQSSAGVAINSTRRLNTVRFNNLVSATLNPSTGQVTLGAGTYIAKGWAGAYYVETHQISVRNDSTGQILCRGTGARNSGSLGDLTLSHVNCTFTLASTQVISLNQVWSFDDDDTPYGGLDIGALIAPVHSELELWSHP